MLWPKPCFSKQNWVPFWHIVFAVIFSSALLSSTQAAIARDKPLPDGMTAEQYQTMVDDIANAVAKKLEAEPKAAKPGKPGKATDEARPAEKREPFDAVAGMR